ncbi:MAG: marine proteobacterial sortase target protein [Burkholderiales bacterium]|nr:marine proteobacterial sortase target protein [Burkholderiales bacterium]
MTLPTLNRATKGDADMAVRNKAGIGDFLQLGANAFVGGLVAAIALSVITLLLAGGAQAATLNDAKTGQLLLRTGNPGEYSVAPTVETEVAIEVTGVIARTRLSQVFHNPGTEFVEGVYVFPLPEKAAVDHLWMRIGERAIEGAIQEKEEARRTYQKAKSEGRKAALVEQQRPNLFTNSVAHIGPGEQVRITIEYQQTLVYDNGEYRLRFPLAVTPRYVPAGAAPDAMPDVPKALEAQLRDGPVQAPAYAANAQGVLVNPVDIAVLIDAGVPIAGVVSSYHEALVEKASGNRTAVYFSREQEAADRDFELKWRLSSGGEPKAAVFTQRVAGAEYGLVMVVPPQPSAEEMKAFQAIPREIVLIADTSGSMQGPSMEQAKQALGFALDTLTERDRFNVVEFNSVTRPLYPASLPATRTNIAQARQWVANLKAGGGTEMAPALTFALDGAVTPGYLRQVIFMTDGGVSNEETLLGLIAARLGESRLFTVGIGSAPNAHFMTKAAQFGRGSFTYVGDVREVNEKMSQLFARIEAPVLRDVLIRWSDGTPLATFPDRVPDLYLGEPIVVSASADSFARTVIVSGLRGNQPWSVALAPASNESAGVGALWARARIAALMDEITRGGDIAQLRPAVVRVALDHHLVSAYTSLVAVDVTPTGPASLKTGLVKASLPQGWTGTIPQTDTASMLHLLLGLLALATAGIVAVVGRTVPARRAA